MKVLLAGAAVVFVVIALAGNPTTKTERAPDPADQGLSPSALAGIAERQAEREARAAMKLKIDPIILRLEAEGITRDDLISYFEKEVVDELDLDGMCKDRDLLP